MIIEAKNRYRLEFKKNFEIGLQYLENNTLFNLEAIEIVLEMLKQDKKFNKEYKHHYLTGKYKNHECVHIPDSSAMESGFEFSDWLLVFKRDDKKKIIYIIDTGTHEYIENN